MVPPATLTASPTDVPLRPSYNSHHAGSVYSNTSFSSSSSTFTVSGLPSASQGEEVTLEGLPHSEARLEARRYKSSQFAADLLYLLRDDLRIKTWTSPNLESSGVKIYKVSGSLTNAVFFVSYNVPSGAGPRTVLLRIYGPSSGSLISRPHELRTLHLLSSIYTIGPRVFGTFGNGRVEEFFESAALTPDDMRDPQTSRWIARRMRELHRVDIEIVSGEEWNDHDVLSVRRNVRDWMAPASEVLDLLSADSSTVTDIDANHPWWHIKEDIDLPRFYREWDAYVSWLKEWEQSHTVSRRVFAHNDAQYGNLLRLAKPKEGAPNHHQIIVVDFEYAAPNPAAFDIANHFLEWTSDYNSATPHTLDSTKYPTSAERRNYYLAYLSPEQPTTNGEKSTVTTPAGGVTPHGVFTHTTFGGPNLQMSRSRSVASIALDEAPANPKTSAIDEETVAELDAEVYAWTAASLAQWTVWGIVQARDDVLAGGVGEFDYLNYARGRVTAFRASLKRIGIDFSGDALAQGIP